jgi:hypothetical protein
MPLRSVSGARKYNRCQQNTDRLIAPTFLPRLGRGVAKAAERLGGRNGLVCRRAEVRRKAVAVFADCAPGGIRICRQDSNHHP